jgi:hypothetical protein
MFRWVTKLPALPLKCLLPLPLLLIAFGLFGEQLTNQVLSLSFVGLDKLQADDPHPRVQLVVKATVIKAEFKQESEYTKVEIETANSQLKKLQFAFPNLGSKPVKTILIRELNLDSTEEKLQFGTQIQGQLNFSIKGVLAVIDKQKGLTKVKIEPLGSAVEQLELEIPITEIDRLKHALAGELGLTRQEIGRLVSYRVNSYSSPE